MKHSTPCRAPHPRLLAAMLWPLLAMLCSCAVGNVHRYDDVTAALQYTAIGQVAVATHDQRPYVLDGERGPQFVGLSRGGFGNTFGVTTASEQPLADDFTAAIGNSLAAIGISAVPVTTTATDNAGAVTERLRATGAPRMVLVTLRDWKSDTYMNTALHFDIELVVLAADGSTRAKTGIRGKDDLGGSAWNPPSHARTAVPVAFRQKLEQLLGDPDVAAALR